MRRGIDHLVVCVPDLDEAARRYEALGFATTPRAQHPWGTDNRLVQLHGNFIELLAITRPERIEPPLPGRFSFGAFNRSFLEHHPGLSMLVFESTDAERDREELDGRGIGGYERFHFERQATLPDGDTVTVAFSLAFSSTPALPAAMFFCCQQHAPQHFWKPQFQIHPNRARRVDEVIMVADDMDAAADYFARLQEADSVHRIGGGLRVVTPRGTIRVHSREGAARRLPGAESLAREGTRQFLGFAVRVDDLAAQRRRLEAAAVAFEEDDGGIWVDPDYALGCLLAFREESADRG